MSAYEGPTHPGRRTFLKTLGAGVAGAAAVGTLASRATTTEAAGVDAPPPGTEFLDLTVNGIQHRLHLEPRTTLAEVLRNHLGLTGTKIACNRGMCGTCTVLLDGIAIYSCHTLALDAAGRSVTTIEGLLDGEELDPLQQSFVDHDGLQCGYCTPGQVMSAAALLRANPDPSVAEIKVGMSGNLCRCGAYAKIIESIQSAKKL